MKLKTLIKSGDREYDDRVTVNALFRNFEGRNAGTTLDGWLPAQSVHAIIRAYTSTHV